MDLKEASGNPMCYFHWQVGCRFGSWRFRRSRDHSQGQWVEHVFLESVLLDGAPPAAAEVAIMYLLLGLGELSLFLDELISKDFHHLLLSDLL